MAVKDIWVLAESVGAFRYFTDGVKVPGARFRYLSHQRDLLGLKPQTIYGAGRWHLGRLAQCADNMKYIDANKLTLKDLAHIEQDFKRPDLIGDTIMSIEARRRQLELKTEPDRDVYASLPGHQTWWNTLGYVLILGTDDRNVKAKPLLFDDHCDMLEHWTTHGRYPRSAYERHCKIQGGA